MSTNFGCVVALPREMQTCNYLNKNATPDAITRATNNLSAPIARTLRCDNATRDARVYATSALHDATANATALISSYKK